MHAVAAALQLSSWLVQSVCHGSCADVTDLLRVPLQAGTTIEGQHLSTLQSQDTAELEIAAVASLLVPPENQTKGGPSQVLPACAALPGWLPAIHSFLDFHQHPSCWRNEVAFQFEACVHFVRHNELCKASQALA